MGEIYKGIPVDSEPEMFVLDWLFELQDRGFIHSIQRGREMQLGLGLVHGYRKVTVMKRKTKEEQIIQTILDPHYYTPDFVVQWFPKALDIHIVSSVAQISYERLDGLFVSHPNVKQDVGQLYGTFIEVKPDHDYQDNTRRFIVNQKWMWDCRKVFINLVKPFKLYKSTFTPQAYLHTRKKKTEREIKWNIRTVDQYLESLNQ